MTVDRRVAGCIRRTGGLNVVRGFPRIPGGKNFRNRSLEVFRQVYSALGVGIRTIRLGPD
jgi:hypothetical protein